MDTLKISLWLFFVLSSATISKSETLKYHDAGDNCFCFNNPGEYKKVPDIMNQDENNIERIAVHFYKVKNTGEIKMYIPNREKQALIPHLAFEVGDKLNTVNENDSTNRLFYSIFGDGTNSPHASQIDNAKVIQPVQDWIQEHSQADDISAKKEETAPSSNDGIVDPTEEQTSSNEAPNAAIALENEINNERDQPQNHFTEIPSKPFHSLENDIFNKRIIIHTVNEIKNNDLSPITNNNINILEIPSENININPDGSDVESARENNLPDELLNAEKYLSEQKTNQNIEPDDDHESYNEEHNENNNASPEEETLTTRYESPIDEQQNISEIESKEVIKPDDSDISLEKSDPDEEGMSIQENESENVNDKNEINPIIENASEKNVDDGNEPWHVEEITEPATSDHSYNLFPEDVLSTQFPLSSLPKDEQNNDPQIDSNDQDSHRDTIYVVDKEENRPVTIHFSEQDINNGAMEEDGQPGGNLTPHETSKTHTYTNSDSSREEPKSDETPFTPHISNEHIALGSHPHHHHHHNNYETFERWFAQQMKLFKTYTNHDRIINLRTIERFILKILHDNGMHVTAEGVLADAFGTALDVRKLHLRPIFIGNTVTLGNVFEAKGSELVLPTNNAYLQAILVTNSEPSLMLGIIPIGKTFIPPSKRISAGLNPYVLHNTWRKLNPIHHQNHAHYRNHPRNGHQRFNQLITKPIRKNMWKGFTVVKKPITLKYKVHKYLNPIRVMKSTKPDSAEYTNNLVTSILGDNDSVTSVETTNELLANLRNGEGPIPAIPMSSGEGVTRDDLGPRIVGGKPATSSGFPLNIKGRMSDF